MMKMTELEFIIGYDLETFRKYYSTLHDLHQFYKLIGTHESSSMELGEDELNHIKRDPRHLIIWKKKNDIIGHTVWHETTTSEMVPGDSRNGEDKMILHKLFDGEQDNLVELHEVWLRTEHRGKGFGHQFFEFFEDFASRSGFAGIVYYTDNPSAIVLCRNRGYREALELEGHEWHVFALSI
jgi:GNAT superfamily N-acetyltransferase